MKQQAVEQEEVEVDDVPVSPVLAVRRGRDYGSVPGLNDDELADPYELERQVEAEQWGPILALPVRTSRGWSQPRFEDGQVDYGAFGTVDFDRAMPEFDKARYRAQKLREELRDELIMLSIVNDRVQGRAKYQVLKQLRLGVIALEQIQGEDMRALGRLYLMTLRMRKQIGELEAASRARKCQRLEAWLASPG